MVARCDFCKSNQGLYGQSDTAGHYIPVATDTDTTTTPITNHFLRFNSPTRHTVLVRVRPFLLEYNSWWSVCPLHRPEQAKRQLRYASSSARTDSLHSSSLPLPPPPSPPSRYSHLYITHSIRDTVVYLGLGIIIFIYKIHLVPASCYLFPCFYFVGLLLQLPYPAAT